MLSVTQDHVNSILEHLIKELPHEGCGVLIGEFLGNFPYKDASALYFIPTENNKKSALAYEIAPKDLLKADDFAREKGVDIIGVVHSHTNSDPYPSVTDIEFAVDPSWYYVIVSFRFSKPTMRAYRIINGIVSEEAIFVKN